jgi:molybdenum cofactor cytidylyltransferase
VIRTFGLVPAAGKSRRMGRPKLSLPLGNRTVVEHVVQAVTNADVCCVLVVTGPDESALSTLAEKAGAAVLRLTEDTAEMRDTIERGLEWLEDRYQPAPEDGWLLLPADHPCIDSEVVRQVIKSKEAAPEKSIVVPSFEGTRGHPTWIAWRHVAGIRALERGLGLNAYLRRYQQETLELPVAAESVLWDLDTPEDYERLVARIGGRDL